MLGKHIKQAGFSLVEVAIVLLIIGLLIGGVSATLSQQLERKRETDTQQALSQAQEALVAFLMANGRLPCPAVSNTNETAVGAGVESYNAATGRCTIAITGNNANTNANNARVIGVLPWVTLGVPQTDAWGRRYRYVVSASWVDNPATTATYRPWFPGVATCATPVDATRTTLSSCSAGTLQVQSYLTGNPAVANNIPAVIISLGSNGRGGFTPNGAQVPAAPAAQAEAENTDNDQIIFTGTKLESGAAQGEFDDQVVWVTAESLAAQMVKVGRLP